MLHRVAATGKDIDLTIPFRLTGLAPGSALDLKRRAYAAVGRVQLAVQLDAQRAQIEVESSCTLWDCLQRLEKSSGQNFLQRTAEGGTYLQPIVQFLNRTVRSLPSTCIRSMKSQIDDLVSLKSMPLSHFGIHSGSALLRVSHRTTSMTLQEVSIALFHFFTH